MFGKRSYLLLALFLMLVLPAFALSGCGGSSGSSSAASSSGGSGSGGSSSGSLKALDAQQLIENYHCGGCHVSEQLGLTNGEGTLGVGNTAPATTDLSQLAYNALNNDNVPADSSNDGFANLLMQVEGAPMGGMDMTNNDTNGTVIPDYVLISLELASIEANYSSGTYSEPFPGANGSARAFYAPIVTSVLPSDANYMGTAATPPTVSYSLPIMITFNEPVAGTNSDVVVKDASGNVVAGDVSVDPNYDMIATWTPTAAPLTAGGMQAGTKYTITIQNVTSEVTTMSPVGIAMAAPYVTTFTTASTPVADGNAIFFQANCAACHANYVTSTGQLGVLQQDGTVTKAGFDGTSLAETGYQWYYAGTGPAGTADTAGGDFSTANLETAIAEMYPGSIDGVTNKVPSTNTYSVIEFEDQNVAGTETPVATAQKLIDTVGIDANSVVTTPVLQGNTLAIADVAAYLETLQDVNGTNGSTGKASGVSLSNDVFLASGTSRGPSIIKSMGCEMCHNVTYVTCPSGYSQEAGSNAVGASDCVNAAGTTAANTGQYTVNALSQAEGAPDFSTVYDLLAGSGNAAAGGSTSNSKVSEYITGHMIPIQLGANAAGYGDGSVSSPSGEGLAVLDYVAQAGNDTTVGDCTGNGVPNATPTYSKKYEAAGAQGTLTDAAGNSIETGTIDCSGTGTGMVSELGVIVNYLRSISTNG